MGGCAGSNQKPKVENTEPNKNNEVKEEAPLAKKLTEA